MQSFLTHITGWLRAVYRWLREARHVWFTLGVVAIALVASFWPGASESRIRMTGLALELIGIGTVAFGIRDTRKLFKLKPLATVFREWFDRRPRWRRDVEFQAEGSVIASASGNLRARAWTRMDSTAPLDAQLAAVISNVERLAEDVARLDDRIDAEARQRAQAIQQEQQVRAKDDHDLRSHLEAAHTGGLHLSFMGVIVLLVGAILSTLATEIATGMR